MARSKGKKKVVERAVRLGCLTRPATLLRCTVLADGDRKRSLLWINKAEWEKVVVVVVMPLFIGSWQLLASRHPPPAVGEADGLAGVTPGNCWLQWPCTVRKSSHTKKERDIKTGCVEPASKSRIASNLAEAAALPSTAARSSDRAVRLSTNGEGYKYVQFDVWGVLAAEEGSNGAWESKEEAWSEEVGVQPGCLLASGGGG